MGIGHVDGTRHFISAIPNVASGLSAVTKTRTHRIATPSCRTNQGRVTYASGVVFEGIGQTLARKTVAPGKLPETRKYIFIPIHWRRAAIAGDFPLAGQFWAVAYG